MVFEPGTADAMAESTESRKICVIDDDSIYQFTVGKMMKIACRIEDILSFPNGQQAINFFKENYDHPESLPDVILLDINMPVMDGWDFLEEYVPLRSRLSKTIRLFMVSSSIDDDDEKRARSYSEVSDFISKPITPQKLKQMNPDICRG